MRLLAEYKFFIGRGNKNIQTLKSKGVTILLVSHYPDDINLICDEIYEYDNHTLSRAESAL